MILLYCQVVNLAVDSLRTAEAEDLPLVIKFLLQSAKNTTVKRIVQQLREHLNFVTVSDVRASKPDHKQKGKSSAPNCEALILEAIRSGLRLQNVGNPNLTYGGTLMCLLFSISVSFLSFSSLFLPPGQFSRPQLVLLMHSCS